MSDPFADYMHEDLYRYHHYLPEGAVEAAPYSPPFYRFEPLDIPFTSQDPMPLDPTSSFLRSPSPIPVPTPLPKLDESDDKEPQRFSIPMNMGRKGTVITTGFVSMFCDDVNTPQTVGVNNGTWKAASSCEDYLNEKGWQSEDAKKIGKKIGVKFDGVNQYQGLDVFRRMHQAGYRVRKPFASIFGDDWEDGTWLILSAEDDT
jgi:hypothetical protein